MKTLIFNVWKEPLEELIDKIGSKSPTKEELDNWFEYSGSKFFEIGQGQYYQAYKSEFLNVPEDTIAYKRTREQLIAGFAKVFSEMKKAFSLEHDSDVNQLCEDFMKKDLTGKYAVIIAPRAPITSEYATMDPTKIEDNIKFVIEQNKFLIESAQRHIASMEARLEQVKQQKAQQSQQYVPRTPSSPVFHRQASPKIEDDRKVAEQISSLQLGKKSP